MEKPKLSIITVNFGQSKNIQKLWISLQKFPPACAFEFIIVDNVSARNEGEKLNKCVEQEKNVHVIQLSKNLGYGGGNAEGARFATGEILAIINPDIEVKENCLDELIHALEIQRDIGIVVPVLETFDGKILQNTRRFPTLWGLTWRRLFGRQFLKKKDLLRSPKSVEWVQGSFLVMRKSLFEDLGGFDPRFFLFLEDTDLCRRVWEKKLKVLQIPMAHAIHQPKRLSGGNLFLALFRKTFWIHLASVVKYFWKWWRKSKPQIF